MAESTKERGCFELMGKKEEKTQEDLVMNDTNPAKECAEGEKHTLMEELQRTRSHSSSSSEGEGEEAEEGGERKKKKKKGLKEAIKDKISGEETESNETCVPMEKCNEENAETAHAEEKKGLIEMIKEKLPGHHKKGEEDIQTPAACEHSPGSNTEEKKVLIDKIKEKLPGHHKSD